ncbi:MAG: M48 family metallopeptidase [Candidatus Caenarcaniphilales bacterium]|nr:M48 family metallopeptidase [Candidatus Caenarcaniphilales bacterium]
MNIFGQIILATLIISYLINLIVDYLNIKSLKSDVPQEFKGIYDQESYQKSQAYTKDKTAFGTIENTFNLILLLCFWFLGGFNALDLWVRSFGFNELISGLVFIASLALAKTVISLPFSLYSTFVIEEKYGFNKSTLSIFVSDLFKGLLLSFIIGLPILALLLTLFEKAGSLAWLYCWIAVTAFSIIMQILAPTLIMPLFNKFSPMPDGELKTAILDYASKVNFSVQDIYVMDGSKRSSKSNAFFSGLGKFKKIALFDTLIENHTVPELVAVLAHEIGHYKKKHILQGMILSILSSGAMFYLLSLFLTKAQLFEAFKMQNISIYAGMLFFGLLYTPVDFLLSIAVNLLSRKNEYEADEFAAKTIQKPMVMADTLKKLSKDNLSNLTPHPLYVFFNYSHPTALQRIEAIQRLAIN